LGLNNAGLEEDVKINKRSKKKYFLIAIWLSFAVSSLFSQDNSGQQAILTELIREALAKNPRIEAAVQRSLSAEKAIPQAGALSDPQVTLGLMNLPLNSFSFNQEPMTGKVISVMQMFPFPGKLALKTDMAEFEASAVKYQQNEIRNQIFQAVKTVYFSLYAIDRARETVDKNRALMEQFVHLAETKYATGSGLQQDVLRAQLELTKLEDDLIMWEQKRLAVEAKLNALLNRPSGTPFKKTPQELSVDVSVLEIVSFEEIEQSRPLLKAWKEKVRKVESALDLAQKDFWPNFTVGASYNQRDDLKNGAKMYDFFSTTVSLNIPLYFKRKQKMKVAEREVELAAVKAPQPESGAGPVPKEG
jgi:cobalt-zinc-cadmium efflux system outer membrane protein